MNELIVKTTEPLNEVAIIEKNVAICQQLLKLPHYAKMGAEGLMAILMVADGLGIDKRLALNGALYMAKSGCIEMKAATMSMLIRKAGHSVTKDEKSDNKICILHGKRSDNGDEWTASFSVDDAKNAGLLNSYDNAWKKYTPDMLYNRALSRLARQLFPDVIGNCYIEGEISQAPDLNQKINREDTKEAETTIEVKTETEAIVKKFPRSLEEWQKLATKMWVMICEKTPQAGPVPYEMPYWLERCQNNMRSNIENHLENWAANPEPFLKAMAAWYERDGQFGDAKRQDEADVG